ELSQATQDCQDEPAVRCGRVGPGISQRLEACAFLRDGIERVQQIAGAASQPVEPRDGQDVTLLEPRQRLAQPGPISPCAARCLAEHLHAASSMQRRILSSKRLPGRAHPCVTVNCHGNGPYFRACLSHTIRAAISMSISQSVRKLGREGGGQSALWSFRSMPNPGWKRIAGAVTGT